MRRIMYKRVSSHLPVRVLVNVWALFCAWSNNQFGCVMHWEESHTVSVCSEILEIRSTRCVEDPLRFGSM